MARNKSKIIRIFIVVVLLCVIMGIVLIVFKGRKPFQDLEIISASVQLLPPDKTIQIEDLEELEKLLEDVVIYERDDSYIEYTGQAVVFTITKSDGSQIEVTAYNPFVIIDGVGYKCKYEPCEKLNSYANELLNNFEVYNNMQNRAANVIEFSEVKGLVLEKGYTQEEMKKN